MSVQTNVLDFPVQNISGSQDFLKSDSKETLSNTLENPVIKKIQTPFTPLITDELLDDLDKLTKMQLRKKYKREAGSHRNRKLECKKNGGKFAEDYEKFHSFLLHVGVCPGPGKWSLDRIDNDNLDYGPGLVRWADDKTQNNNKSDTIHLTHNNQTMPLTWWAEETDQRPDTLRKRHQRGWPDHQVILGKPKSSGSEYSSNASGVWKRLVPDSDPETYKALEAEFRQSWHFSATGSKARMYWLGAVAVRHMDALGAILQEHEAGRFPEREFQYACWADVAENIKRVSAANNDGFEWRHCHSNRRQFSVQFLWRH